ncbi:MAG TPA: glycerophosphodiester phosphodiesterase [Acidimicrobiales bacterium]|nr:glycerophosphodiester phosphodiesterase [Acidimicrobiales bacterium]
MTLVIAHRGASAHHPENTVAAFVGARELGADWVELDVRRTADHALAVHHDAHLADGRDLVELLAEALPPDVPHLLGALDACHPLGVNVEIKNWPADVDFDPELRLADAVVAVLAEHRPAGGVVVSSFHFGTIDRVRALDASVPTAWLIFQALDPAATVARVAEAGHAGIHPHASLVDEAFVARAHDAGLFVNVWTVDDPVRIAELVALGVDGVVTNRVDVARTVVDRGAVGAD